MTTPTAPSLHPKPGALISMVAAFQILIALLSLWIFFRTWGFPVTNQETVRGSEIVLTVSLAIAAVVTLAAIGLMLLKSWARYLTLFLATVPLCITTAALIRHKPHPWDFDLAVLQIGVALLAPISLWWWIVFNLKTVRARFRQTM